MTTPSHAPAAALSRSLSFWHALLYGLGVTIGAGIYVLIGPAAARAGMSAPLAFVLAAVLMALTAASFSELASRMPVAAGEAAYVEAGFKSKRLALATGLLVIAMAIISAATISVGSSGYIRAFLPLPQAIVIALVVFAMGAVAAWGILQSVTFAGIMTVIEIGGLMLVLGAGFASEGSTAHRLPELIPSHLDLKIVGGLLGAALVAVFAFIGFEGIVNIAEEVQEPTRTIPRAIFVTLALTTVLYALVMWICLVVAGPDGLAASQAPLAVVFTKATGVTPRFMSAIAIVATLNGIIVQMIMASRVMYGLADQGHLPRDLAAVSPVTHTPLRATMLTVAVVLVLAVLLDLESLADLSARLTLGMFALVNLALVRIKAREISPPAGIYLAPRWAPMAGFVSCLALLVADILV